MNKDQRTKLEGFKSQLDDLKSEIEDIAADEKNKFDNLSEGLQASERGQKFQENAEILSNVVSSLEETISELEGVE